MTHELVLAKLSPAQACGTLLCNPTALMCAQTVPQMPACRLLLPASAGVVAAALSTVQQAARALARLCARPSAVHCWHLAKVVLEAALLTGAARMRAAVQLLAKGAAHSRRCCAVVLGLVLWVA